MSDRAAESTTGEYGDGLGPTVSKAGPPALNVDPEELAEAETAELFKLTSGGIINSLVPALILAIVTAFTVGVFLPASWLAIILILAGVRLLLDRLYEKNPHRWPHAYWKHLIILYQLVHGTAWAATIYVLVISDNIRLETLLVFLGTLPTVGVIVSHGSAPRSIIAFTTPFTLAFAIYFLTRDALLAQILGVLWALSAVHHIFSAFGVHRDVMENLKLRLANAGLFKVAREEKEKADQSARYLQNVLNTLEYSVMVLTKDFKVVAWNNATINMGLMPADLLHEGADLADLIRANAERGIYDPPEDPDEVVEKVIDLLNAAYRRGGHVTRHGIAGGREVEVRTHIMPNGDFVVSSLDVTEHKKAVIDTIRHMAYHDGLTDLPNRVAFRSKLEDAMDVAVETNELVAVLVLDIHRFRDVNDSMGHRIGDTILRNVATRLLRIALADEAAARLSSDEFAVILRGKKEKTEISARAEEIIDSLQDPMDVNGKRVHISVSAGISVYPHDASTVDQMMTNADLALNKAKEKDESGWSLFDESMNHEVVEANSLQNDIRRALDSEEFTIHYQPQIDFRTGRVTGAEALIRWEHPERGWVSPGKFIPVAEMSRLIVPLTEWILPTACREAKSWIGRGWDDLVVSVNLSPLHFKTDGLVDLVYQTLVETGLPAENLELELTEGMVIPDAERVLNILNSLAELGVQLAVDDFGTGYSSMSYLKAFPFHKLKIDRTFIGDLAKGQEMESIVEAIIRVGHTLGHRVVAEGVETGKQADILKRLGCDGAQGFYYSGALPSDRFVQWIESYAANGLSSETRLAPRLCDGEAS